MNYCVFINKLSELLGDEFIQLRENKNVQRCFTSTETVRLIRDGGRVGKVIRTQAHLPVHSGGRSFFLSWSFTSTETGRLIRNGVRVG